MDWYERRDTVDEYGPADLDELAERLLTLVQPTLRARPCGCRVLDVVPGQFCDFCGSIQQWERKAA